VRSSGIQAAMRVRARATALGDYSPAKVARNGSPGRIVLSVLPLRPLTPLSSVAIPPVFNMVRKTAATSEYAQPGGYRMRNRLLPYRDHGVPHGGVRHTG